MMSEQCYGLQEVRKSYPPRFALRIDQLDVHKAEVLAVLGPNGAGKSTLLRLLAALEDCNGLVQFEGVPLVPRTLSLKTRRRITMVFQRPLLLDGSVKFNIEYGLRLRKIPDQSAAVHLAMDRLKLWNLAEQSAQTLSGGQSQLVALARALAIKPDVLLLDEPTASLDPSHVALVEETIGHYQRESRMTVVWATHSLFQAQRVSARSALLLDGQLIEVAPTKDFFGQPADPRTAAFVQGKMVY